MSAYLCPALIFRGFDNNGNPLLGGQLFSYGAGTAVPQATYVDSTQTTQNTNPVILNARGEAQVWLDPSKAYKFILQDSFGNTIYTDDNVAGALAPTGSIIPSQDNVFTLGNSSFSWANIYVGPVPAAVYDPVSGNVGYYAQTAGEIAASVTPVNFSYYPGDGRRYGMVGDGVTDNTVAFQNALSANADYYPVRLIAGPSFYAMSARVTAPANTHVILEDGSELRWTATTANGTNLLGSVTRPGIEILGDNFVLEGRGKFTGPTVATYVGNECGILRIGTSAAARGTGITISDVEFSNWGAYGVVAQFCQSVHITRVSSHNNGYMGFGWVSCQFVRIAYCQMYSIGPGTSGNMYGVSFNHDSTNYNTDPNVTALPRQTVNPFCIDCEVTGCEVYSINWLGIDAHGGYEINVHDNKVYDCYIGIQVASSSNAGANYAGENNAVCHNEVYASQINGNASTTSGHSGQQFGITINGGATLLHRGVRVIGNTIVGCGDTSGAGTVCYSIQCTLNQDCVIMGNVIRSWYSIGIYGSNFDGTISNNMFDAVANSTLTKCLWVDSNSARTTINGNRLEIHGGTAPLEGIRIASSGSTRPIVSGNDVWQATTAYSGNAATFTAGLSDIVPRLQDATTGSHTVDLTPLNYAPLMYYQYTGAGTATITSFQGAAPGQLLSVYNSSSSTLTINNTGSTIKLSGGSQAPTQFGTVLLLCVGTAGNPQFVQIGGIITNT